MHLSYKIQLMQRLQQAYAVFLRNSVTSHQMPVPRLCLPPFTPPSNASYHKTLKRLQWTIYFNFGALVSD
jgi:hypothetical protein